ncbi:MAG: sialidase family protein, partial [Bacteroidota bacterium]
MNRSSIYLLLLSLCWALSLPAQGVQTFKEQPIFQNGEAGYACYRIPAIVKSGDGRLLAFAEGRKNGCNDFGNLDIVLKTSTDQGETWSALQVVVDNGTIQAGNPAPVVDLKDPNYPNGRVMLVYNTGNNGEYEVRHGKGLREVWLKTSDDHGVTWSEPRNITSQAHRPSSPPKYNFQEDWRSYALTPGHAIQLQSGRIYVSANHSVGAPKAGFNEYQSHAIYSDDHGANWKISESVDIPSSNEAMAVELTNGQVMLNIRQQNGEK